MYDKLTIIPAEQQATRINFPWQLTISTSSELRKVYLHSHDFYELYFFLSGNARYIVENGNYSLRPGDLLLIPPHRLHQLDVLSSGERYSRIVLWINPTLVDSLGEGEINLSSCFDICDERKNYLLRDSKISNRIKNTLERIESVQRSTPFGSQVEIKCLITSVLLDLARFLKEDKNSLLRPEGNQMINNVLTYIDNHLKEDLTLEKLAKMNYVSKYYLAHLFKDNTKVSLHQFITKKRLALSKSYLDLGLSAKQICQEVGIEDYCHFLKSFKKEYGITPKQYLKQVKDSKFTL